MNAPRLLDVRFTPASDTDAAVGLLAYVSCTFEGLLRLDGLTLRRTLAGRVTLTYPARTDRAGRRHPYYRPVDDDARLAIEAQVFAALGLQAQEAA